MIYLYQILTNLYLEEELVSVSVWPELLYLANLISDNFWSTDWGHNPRHGIWNDPICLVYHCASMYQNLLKCRRLWNQKENVCSHRTQKRKKWRQPWFWLHLVTKSCGRQELGLPTLSAVVHLWKMMPHTMFHSKLFKFFVNSKFTVTFSLFVHG